MFAAQLLLQQFRAQGNAHQMLPNTVVQIVSNPSLFAAATLDHLALKSGPLGDLLLKQRGPLLPQSFKFVALLLARTSASFRDVISRLTPVSCIGFPWSSSSTRPRAEIQRTL